MISEVMGIQTGLALLGYDAGTPDGVFGQRTRAALKSFQSDVGLDTDGVYGQRTDAALRPLVSKVQARLKEKALCRRLRVTTYYLVEELSYIEDSIIPVYQRSADGGKVEIARVGPAFFADLALEGTGILTDGSLINVQGGDTVPVDSKAYDLVFNAAQKRHFSHVEYAGIRLDPSGTHVERAITFVKVTDVGEGFGLEHGIPKKPWLTCAADASIFKFGDQIYVPELDGLRLPGGKIHDGVLTVNDTGSAIRGLHIDWFVGTRRLALSGPRQPEFPRLCHVISDRINLMATDYTFGLIPT